MSMIDEFVKLTSTVTQSSRSMSWQIIYYRLQLPLMCMSLGFLKGYFIAIERGPTCDNYLNRLTFSKLLLISWAVLARIGDLYFLLLREDCLEMNLFISFRFLFSMNLMSFLIKES